MLDLTVMYNEEPIFELNSSLVLRQKLNQDDVDKIKDLHLERLDIETSFMNNKINPSEYLNKWTSNQFKLQQAWGFKKNPNFHRFWDMPGCGCTRVSNLSIYPNGPYKFNHNCRVHGHLSN